MDRPRGSLLEYPTTRHFFGTLGEEEFLVNGAQSLEEPDRTVGSVIRQRDERVACRARDGSVAPVGAERPDPVGQAVGGQVPVMSTARSAASSSPAPIRAPRTTKRRLVALPMRRLVTALPLRIVRPRCSAAAWARTHSTVARGRCRRVQVTVLGTDRATTDSAAQAAGCSAAPCPLEGGRDAGSSLSTINGSAPGRNQQANSLPPRRSHAAQASSWPARSEHGVALDSDCVPHQQRALSSQTTPAPRRFGPSSPIAVADSAHHHLA